MRSIAFNLVFYALTLYAATRVYLLSLRGRREAMLAVLRWWGESTLRAVEIVLGGRVEIRGLDRIPAEGPVMFVAKHQSELDIVLLGALMPHTGAVAMQELERYPFFGPILRALDIVLVAVERGPQKRTEQTVEGARRTFEQGRPMTIYPEGTLMRLGDKERYRRGAAHIYTRLGPTVVPVATSVGTIWPRRDWWKNPGMTGAIEYLEPIPPGLPFETFMARIEATIEENTWRLIREHATPAMIEEAESRRRAALAREADAA